jgi:hypothetical protein
MLRFMLRMRSKYTPDSSEFTSHFTLDADVPDLESMLLAGGLGNNAYEITELVGVEVRPRPGDRIPGEGD